MVGRIIMSWIIALAACAVGGGSVNAGTLAGVQEIGIAIPHPKTMLLRDQTVHRELKLDRDQIAAIDAILAEVELPLWRLRNERPAEQSRASKPLLQKLDDKLADVLTDKQSRRLEQIVLQGLGIRGFVEPRVAASLSLSPTQTETIKTILMRAAQPNPLRTPASPLPVQEALAVLSTPQRRRLNTLLGTPFDVSSVPHRACRAPEFENVTAWIGSEPLKLEQLRGRVVVVHFYTYGCINCIHNLGHYNDWHARFPSDRFAIIGIHKPEFPSERDIDRVRAKAADAGIEYPVAVDNADANWDAWANRVWPSIYLIDKDGFVRYWWYGELNWQQAEGERWMRDRIVELLNERLSS